MAMRVKIFSLAAENANAVLTYKVDVEDGQKYDALRVQL
jgi:hypothetical protein